LRRGPQKREESIKMQEPQDHPHGGKAGKPGSYV
jgi:hypothetical protein